ncbi:PREDICTED: uncharacterized protein LOC106109888 [Papilio polytes]|uniref:uncharacterized protein LOC106109888 n=1 Tax=Papilio polytes TaxID=76194 RepID=UPI000675F995|nr:PREDICTED: uncharacterized protein LOC106109888 [Papilio polytes]
METETIIIVSVFGGAWLLMLLLVIVLFVQVAILRKRLADVQATGRLRVQKLKMNPDKNYAFNNPSLVPDEELTRRGYSMYVGAEDDIESGRPAERQTGGQFVEELTRELDHRQQRRANAPPFLPPHGALAARAPAALAAPRPPAKQSHTNPNFIY